MLEWIRKNTAETGAKTRPHMGPDSLCDGMLITGQNGLVAGTHVASNLGWRAVDQLSVGDKELTFDNGMQTITDIQRETLWSARNGRLPLSAKPIFVPWGALFGRCDLWPMPEQGC